MSALENFLVFGAENPQGCDYLGLYVVLYSSQAILATPVGPSGIWCGLGAYNAINPSVWFSPVNPG